MVWLLVALLPAAGPVLAVEEVAVFTAAVPVDGRDDASRTAAMRDALAQVLVRLTGDASISTQPRAGKIVTNAEAYLLHYRFMEGTEEDPSQRLYVQFDAAALQAAAAEAGLPVWSVMRPVVLVWLAADDSGDRRLISEDDTTGVRAAVQRVSAQRGIPVILPLLDLEDRQRVTASDVWAEFDDVVSDASERYGADVIVSGRAARLARGDWRASWRLHGGEQSTVWVTEEATLDGAVAAGVVRLADLLGARLAVRHDGTAAQASGSQLTVEGVGNLVQLARAQHYLEGLGQLDRLVPERIGSGSVTFGFRLRGSLADLEQTLSLGAVLERQTADALAGSGASSAPLFRYRLRPN